MGLVSQFPRSRWSFLLASQHYVLPETELHPVVAAAALELECLLSAYGLVPADAPQTVLAQPEITGKTLGKYPGITTPG
jgi:hypothetical protein